MSVLLKYYFLKVVSKIKHSRKVKQKTISNRKNKSGVE